MVEHYIEHPYLQHPVNQLSMKLRRPLSFGQEAEYGPHYWDNIFSRIKLLSSICGPLNVTAWFLYGPSRMLVFVIVASVIIDMHRNRLALASGQRHYILCIEV